LKDKLQHRLSEKFDPVEKRTADGEAYNPPALASRNPQTDHKPPHLELGTNDLDELEKITPGTRALRKHLSSKVGNNPWAVPTPAPHVDPEGFEDPISDAFWENVWKACATHNVCYLCVGVVDGLILFRRLTFIAKFSMLSLMTILRRGSNTKNLLSTTNASLSRFVNLLSIVPPLKYSHLIGNG
jgi:hypothetical protein